MNCECTEIHTPRRIVLTGGPGAGKTAVLELIRESFCEHVHVVPEAASVVFGGGFPRLADLDARRAAQRAIFHVQHELEAALGGIGAAVLLCDRGTLDSEAYWPGPGSMCEALGTKVADELARYHAVIHLRTPTAAGGYDHRNPLRVETAAEAAAIDERIAAAWARHPRRHEVAPAADFLAKAARAVEILRAEMPACCREHEIAALEGRAL
jgi:predicted ATPase